MAQYQVQSPDGKTMTIEGPEGASQDQVIAVAKKLYAQQQQVDADGKKYAPTNDMGTGEKVLAGIGRGMTSAARGVGQLVGLVSDDDVAEAKKLDAPLMNTTAGKVGSAIGTTAVTAPAIFIPGANTYAGAGLIGAGTGALTTEGTAKDRAENAVYGYLGGLAGKGAGDVIASGVNKLAASNAVKAAAYAAKAEPAAAARTAGYVVPAKETNPSAVNSILEGFAGPAQTAKKISSVNQPVTNKLAADAVGLEGKITPEAIAAARAEANQAYAAVKDTGTVTADDTYRATLGDIAKRLGGASKDFPDAVAPEVGKLVDSVNVKQFGADSAVDLIGALRSKASDAFAKGDKQLGKASREVANALEDQLERHLENNAKLAKVYGLEDSGPATLVQEFRDARTQLAKLHDVERATNPATGDVNAAYFGKQLDKQKPLTNELLQIAEAQRAFPNALQTLKETPAPISQLDTALLALKLGTGRVLNAATFAARPLVRNMLASKGYQSAMSAPSSGNALTQLLEAANNDAAKRSLQAAGTTALIPSNKQ